MCNSVLSLCILSASYIVLDMQIEGGLYFWAPSPVPVTVLHLSLTLRTHLAAACHLFLEKGFGSAVFRSACALTVNLNLLNIFSMFVLLILLSKFLLI